MTRILVVDDDASVLRPVSLLLEQQGHHVDTAETAEEALARLDAEPAELVLMDVWLPGISGLDAFRLIRARSPLVPVVLMTGTSSTDLAIEASKLGAYAYCLKPLDPELLLATVGRALESARILSSQAADPARPGGFDETIVGNSPAMQEVYRAIGRVASTDATVLIRGESGTGKELVARAIHRHSPRRKAPLLAVNCVAIPETLLESELFGFERGAFTGAVARRVGKFELANGGSILLDEIGDIPIGMQAKVLRLVQEKTFERVGGNHTLQADVRIMAATNRDLPSEIHSGRFREDLYYRLNVVAVSLPALRDRRQDIPLLTDYFLSRFCNELQIEVPKLTEDARSLLEHHQWPGNVRELEHCVKRVLIFSAGFPVRAADIERTLETPPTGVGVRDRKVDVCQLARRYLRSYVGPNALSGLMDEVERELLIEALRQAGGRQTRAAQILGLARPTLHAKMQRHGVRVEDLLLGPERQRSEGTSVH